LWQPSVHMIAHELGVKLDKVRGAWEAFPTDKELQIAAGKIEAGTVGAIRFEIAGIVGGETRIAIEHITRLHADVAPHWATLDPGGFRVIIEGAPSLKVDVALTEAGGDPCVQACQGTGCRAANSIPVVCEADPGIKTFLNLPRRVMGKKRMRIA
jgi:2,4-diaminopentanoate dehydrogenase